MSKTPLIVALGEVLWDMFPNGSQLGGAPANFAVHCAALGAQTTLLSCVGDDALGDDAVSVLSQHKVDTQWIRKNKIRATGTVQVTLRDGQPSYEIVEGVAWDHIVWQEEFEALAKLANAVCFGTLAQRAPDSRETIQRFIDATPQSCLRVLDINFRQHYHSEGVVRQSLALANALKLSDEEIGELRSYVGGSEDVDAFMDDLRTRFHLKWIVLTLGKVGCRIFGADASVTVKSEPKEVVNTVGAGDAFTAAFVSQFFLGASLETCAKHANEVGGYVVTQDGAMPSLPASFRMFR